ncbi:PSD1 and planctomycete cytochrome C domain-containing protein [Roseimicrobium sp. ORNL1]|uniref:PSD1 and planctomycete cytochrome C domain-containing protein n=1 Tax=Roseimicrobium sp. ORNL1 TaxID=2711231 RepID=UPI0013E17346|nr:PSD1 and planctomycete cytochrome C domain-containing protein [Roseimicrobium sp. ORNL1]QIF00162.1 DUF1549 domain-containing protein [Roseimicrobium sp. ORNL1]
MSRLHPLRLASLSSGMTWVAAAVIAPITHAAAPVPDFDKDVRPIFAESCLECHSLDKAKGGLSLVSLQDALKVLKSGVPALIPGKPEESELIKRVVSTHEDEIMPPKEKKHLTAKQIETLKQWIASGAEWPAHWAYRPVGGSEKSKVKSQQGGESPIDDFVREKLAAAKIAPSPEADKTTLIRRVSYDLLGLPPTPEEVDAFVKDTAPNAYEKMVDAALASQHFGERWGRHWLDMARYADSDGYEKDRPRPDAWRYRDWVIRAVNEDMPFDEFTIEQLAGDLLPEATQEQMVATAFHRQTLTNTEGGTDQEQFRVEATFDRTETTGTVWMGLSVGCARCHTHKYDQITQKEYFQIYAFYNNGDEVSRQVPTSPTEWAAYVQKNGGEVKKLVPLQKELDEATAALPVKLPEWEKEVQARLTKAREAKLTQNFAPLEIASISSKSGSTFKTLPDGSQLASGKQSKVDAYTIELAPSAKSITALQIEVLPDESLPKSGPGRATGGNFVLSEVKATTGQLPVLLHSAKADVEQKGFKAVDAIDGKPDTGWAISGFVGKRHVLTLQLATPLAAGSALRLQFDQNYAKSEHNLGRFRVLAAAEETEASIAPADVVKILNEEPKRRNPVVIKALYEWMAKLDVDVMMATTALDTAQAKLPKAPLMDVRVIAQRNRDVRTTKVLHRGDFLSPAEEVKPAALAVLPPIKTRGAEADRLDFARWLVSRENPLTARVTVNHIWARLFGEGIVRTVNDFGVRGDQPSHPALLDWLAATFMDEDGWSRKKLIKRIMMSATYRQSSAHRADLVEVDPQNKLLARQNRMRVEGEVVRDLYLTSSGLLSRKIGGPSVYPPMPPDIAALSYANNFKWATSTGEDRNRRGMYTFFKRTAPHPDLMTFDCPDANTTNVKRTVSNTPLQALTTLNAESYAEAAKALAKRVLEDKALANDDERLIRSFRLCVSRVPTEKEIKSLRALLYDSRTWYTSHADEAKALTKGYESTDISTDELAAWTATARIVLNLDEFVTRE